MREKYEAMSLAGLREIAKERNMKHISSMRKGELIDALLQEDTKQEEAIPRSPEPSREDYTRRQEENARRPEDSARRSEDGGRRQEETYRTRDDGNTQRNRMDGMRTQQVRRSYDRADRTERTDRFGRSERSDRNDRADRTERSDRTDRNDRTDRSDRTERAERSDRTDRNDRADRTERNDRSDRTERVPMDLAALDSGQRVSGILEVMADGYGFIRSNQYLPGENDVYVAPSQIRKFGLKTGDIVAGNTRIKAQQEKFSALLYVSAINGMPPSLGMKRKVFEEMTPIFPDYRLLMERGESRDIAMRVVDLIAPIGKGQRGMIVSPPKAGKTTLLKEIAKSILKNNPYMHIMIMLIDERPEEVTDIREAIVGERVEVLYSTFDEQPEHHIKVAEMGIERAKRLVEYGEDVTILLDSITRLARASNLTVVPSGRTLSGGLDPAALNMPKRFFGAARNMREGGSLTILATALVDTGSKMDDVVYEEFKGTGNMELVLDRKLSERRIFPAIDIQKSSTRREDLLLKNDELEAVFIMRKALNGMKSDEAVENILNLFVHTRDNSELTDRIRRQRFI